jgi:sugar-specific transcriptional regulator TrmB
MTTPPQLLAALRELGFSELEAEVYVYVVAHPPMTAYRIARENNKPTANVYKAVDALARRGAVIVEEGEARACRAVPIGEFLRQTEQAFLDRTRAAEEMLARLQPHTFDERVYRLESVEDVLGRCRQMLEKRSSKVAVIDAFPAALAAIMPSIRRCVKRGVAVYVEAYEPIAIEGASVALAPGSGRPPEQWGSQQLNVVVDGREHVAALLSNDLRTVYQAVWSESRYLSLLLHSGRLCEHTLARLIASREQGQPERERIRLLDEHPFFMQSEVPGQRELLARHLPKENIAMKRRRSTKARPR